MKIIAALLLALVLSCDPAHAATTVNFGPASACPTYCYGFTTDNADYALGFLNATYALAPSSYTVASVNGKAYRGTSLAEAFGDIVLLGRTHTFYQVSGVLVADDGSAITVAYTLEYWTTKVVSGRDAGHLTPHRAIGGGSVVVP